MLQRQLNFVIRTLMNRLPFLLHDQSANGRPHQNHHNRHNGRPHQNRHKRHNGRPHQDHNSHQNGMSGLSHRKRPRMQIGLGLRPCIVKAKPRKSSHPPYHPRTEKDGMCPLDCLGLCHLKSVQG
jgi:hypothetical protein